MIIIGPGAIIIILILIIIIIRRRIIDYILFSEHFSGYTKMLYIHKIMKDNRVRSVHHRTLITNEKQI